VLDAGAGAEVQGAGRVGPGGVRRGGERKARAGVTNQQTGPGADIIDR
jgi:hypothetical protein